LAVYLRAMLTNMVGAGSPRRRWPTSCNAFEARYSKDWLSWSSGGTSFEKSDQAAPASTPCNFETPPFSTGHARQEVTGNPGQVVTEISGQVVTGFWQGT